MPVPQGRATRGPDGKRAVGPLLSPETTISALFCGGAKGAALGARASSSPFPPSSSRRTFLTPSPPPSSSPRSSTAIVSVLYGGFTPEARGIVSLPLVLYQVRSSRCASSSAAHVTDPPRRLQGSQVALGQGAVYFLRQWNERQKLKARELEEGKVSDGDDEAARGPSEGRLDGGKAQGK